MDPRSNKICICQDIALQFACGGGQALDATLYEELFHLLQRCVRKDRDHPDHDLPISLRDRFCVEYPRAGQRMHCNGGLGNYPGKVEAWCMEINEQCKNPVNPAEQKRSCKDFCELYEAPGSLNEKCCKVFCGAEPSKCDATGKPYPDSIETNTPTDDGKSRNSACCDWVEVPTRSKPSTK